MSERAIVFGKHRGLIGVLTEPEGAVRHPIAVLFWNIGTHHRVGPFRMNVELARRLATEGYTALRFDLSGVGDSEPRPGVGESDEARHVLDVREAMDWLETNTRIHRFVLVGLCSGVDSAHPVARDDARVVGAVFIDGYLFRTRAARTRHYSRGLVRRWLRAARVRLAERRMRGTGAADDARNEVDMFDRYHPTRTEFQADIARMTDRGAHLLFVNTGTVHGTFNDADQTFETLGPGARRDLIRSEIMPDADHLFTAPRLRVALADVLSGWLRGVRPSAVGAPEG